MYSEEIYLFLNISNEELFEPNEGRNIKFKIFTKNNSEQNIDLIDKLNKAMDDPDSEMMTAKDHEPDEISFLFSGTSPNRSFFHYPSESSNGGTLIYIKQGIKYKLRKDLQIYKSKEIESALVEVLQTRKKMVLLLGDFNADLLKYGDDEEVADFLDATYCKLVLPNISCPTRITSTSATLIDNILQMTMITY